ncbi:DUF2917 family protein [Roseimicrobium gellanilyticum]|uniref:DUF2917 family protein n=2 Tax=Roseimicrobium gellanilyticum TaxID=748857 RepID=A0A366HQM2_9BACT|nr:DUF2917 family protein [Roseimicrobium gellanilyticum]
MGKVIVVNLFNTDGGCEDSVMNTSSLSLRASRPNFRTTVGGMLHRIGEALEKLWTLSGRVSLPGAVSTTEAAHLPRGMVFTLEKSDGVSRLELTQGRVWITGTPARGDTILGPGEAYEFGNCWPYVIEALEEAEFIASSTLTRGTVVTS